MEGNQSLKLKAQHEERRLSRSWAINNREMAKREQLKREILEKFGPPNPELVAKYRKRANW